MASEVFGLSLWRRWLGALLFVIVLISPLGQGITVDVGYGYQECFIITAKAGDLINANYEVLTPGPMQDIMVTLKSGGGSTRIKEAALYIGRGEEEDYFTREATHTGDYELCLINKEGVGAGNVESNNSQGDKLVGLEKKIAEAKARMELALEKRRAKNVRSDANADAASRDSSSDNDRDLELEMELFADDLDGTDDGVEDPKRTDDDDDDEEESGTRTIGFDLRIGGDADPINLQGLDKEQRDQITIAVEEAEKLLEHLTVYGDHQSFMRSREAEHHEMMSSTNFYLLSWTFLEALVLLVVSWSQISYIREFFETKRVM